MTFISPPSDFFDLALAADKLRVPADTVLKLRRALDPALSFEEHRDIFPLDLGPIWNLAAFSATRHIAKGCTQLQEDKSEWMDIIEQFQITFNYGVMAGNPELNFKTSFYGKQSVVTAGYQQIRSGIHLDPRPYPAPPEKTRRAFKESWSPPNAVRLIARDVAPTAVAIKCFDAMPANLIWGEDIHGRVRFHDERLIEKAKTEDKLVEFTPGHVVAITNRVLHVGRPVHSTCTQTLAFSVLGWGP